MAVVELYHRGHFVRIFFGDTGDVARSKSSVLLDVARRTGASTVLAVAPQVPDTLQVQLGVFFIFVSLFAAFIPDHVVGDMTSIGTLFAFVLVSIGIIIMRKIDPEHPRPFRTPLVPVVPILAVLVCGAMIFGLGKENWSRLVVWLMIGFVIYFGYSIRHSKVQLAAKAARTKKSSLAERRR